MEETNPTLALVSIDSLILLRTVNTKLCCNLMKYQIRRVAQDRSKFSSVSAVSMSDVRNFISQTSQT